MMIDKVLILLVVTAMAACSAKNKKQEGTATEQTPQAIENDSQEQTPAPLNVGTEAKQDKKDDIAKINNPSSSLALEKAQSGLIEAIRSQNDEAIYRAGIQVLNLSSKDLKAQNALGLYHYKKGRYLAAQYFFEKALLTYPHSGDLYNNLGLVHLALKENREAIRAFRKAIEEDPKNGVAAANLGAMYVEQRNFLKAVVPLEIAINRGIKDYRTLVNFGVSLEGSNKVAQAKEQYEQALKLNSTGREAIYNLAVLDIEQLKLFQDGLDLLNKVKFLGVPDSARMRINVLENKAKAGLK